MSMSESKISILDCPLCLKTYEDPRILPCQHSACEKCLSSYIKDIVKKGGQKTGLPCPVCKRKTKFGEASSFKKSLTITSILDSKQLKEKIQKASAKKKRKVRTIGTQANIGEKQTGSKYKVKEIQNKRNVVEGIEETRENLENGNSVTTQTENIAVMNNGDDYDKVSVASSATFFDIFKSTNFWKCFTQGLLYEISLILLESSYSFFQSLRSAQWKMFLLDYLTGTFCDRLIFLIVLLIFDVAFITACFFLPYLLLLVVTFDLTLNTQSRLAFIDFLHEKQMINKKCWCLFLLINIELLRYGFAILVLVLFISTPISIFGTFYMAVSEKQAVFTMSALTEAFCLRFSYFLQIMNYFNNIIGHIFLVVFELAFTISNYILNLSNTALIEK